MKLSNQAKRRCAIAAVPAFLAASLNRGSSIARGEDMGFAGALLLFVCYFLAISGLMFAFRIWNERTIAADDGPIRAGDSTPKAARPDGWVHPRVAYTVLAAVALLCGWIMLELVA